jgi:hypothetical protein
MVTMVVEFASQSRSMAALAAHVLMPRYKNAVTAAIKSANKTVFTGVRSILFMLLRKIIATLSLRRYEPL